MVEFRWIEMQLFVMLVLQLTAATGQQSAFASFIVREGDAVTLPCKNVIPDQVLCRSTTWLFDRFISPEAVALVELGESKSGRLSVTPNCSLAINRTTKEDVGRYFCRQFKSSKKAANDTLVYLSLVNITERKDTDKVTLTCTVLTFDACRHTLRWLHNGTQFDISTKDIQISRSSSSSSSTHCSITAHFITYNEKYKEQFQCEVIDFHTKEGHVFSITRQSSDETNKATPTTSSTTSTMTSTTTATMTSTTTATMTSTTTATIPSASDTETEYVYVGAGFAALLLVVVVLICCLKRSKRYKTPDDNIGLTLSPAASNPEAKQNTTDPDDDVAYASISHAQQMKTTGKARVRGNEDDDDEDGAVTYATVRVSSSPAAASADTADLYATVNKQNK